MSYLIDTNVISELVKSKQNPEVMQWFNSVQDQDLYLSVLTIGEIRKGISKIMDPQKKEKLRMWLDQELATWFGDHILPINEQVANKWGIIQSQSTRALPAIDSLIIATALYFKILSILIAHLHIENFILDVCA